MLNFCRYSVMALIVILPSVSVAQSKIYAVVIGNNHSLDSGVAPLLFADNDAARYYELFRAAGADLALFTVLDEDAQRRFPEASAIARPPKRDDITNTLNGFFENMAQDQEKGIETQFYFVFSGHGGLGENQEGYLNLLDDKLTRSMLYREILARSKASFNHVILDACKAYFVVNKRGGRDKTGDYRHVIREFLRKEDLASYPNTGVILAASSESETHEWSRWQSGIFTHELVSALLGGGDVNRDGRVTYREAAAFVEAANAAIDDPNLRLRVFFRAPAMRADAALMENRALAVQAFVQVEPEHSDKYYIEDARGLRVADFHPSREQSMEIALLGQAPFFLRTDEREAVLEAPSGPVSLKDFPLNPRSISSRGSADLSFKRFLFNTPFGIGFYNGLQTANPEDLSFEIQVPADEDSLRILPSVGWGTLGIGSVSAVVGGVFYSQANATYREYMNAKDLAIAESLHQKTLEQSRVAEILCIAGGSAALVGAALLVWDLVSSSKSEEGPVVGITGQDGSMGFVVHW